jgi:hypothetical protein
MAEELKLQRTREQWSKSDPKFMAKQSPAAIMYALQDAKRDIEALHRYAEKMSAQLPSHGGAAVGVVLTEEQMGIGYDRRTGPVLWFGGYPKGGYRLYTHPADQVAEGVVVSRELLRFLLGESELNGVAFGDPKPPLGKFWWRTELRPLLAKP